MCPRYITIIEAVPHMQYVVEEVLGAHGMINYVDARTAWMDDIVKQAQWQGITQVSPGDTSTCESVSLGGIRPHTAAWRRQQE